MPPTFLTDTPTNSDLEGKLNCKQNSYNFPTLLPLLSLFVNIVVNKMF